MVQLTKSAKSLPLFILTLAYFLFPGENYGQNQKAKKIGRFSDFISNLSTRGTDKILAGLDTSLNVNINVVKSTKGQIEVIGQVKGSLTSSIFFTISPAGLEGKVVLPEKKLVFAYYTNGDAEVMVAEQDINEVLCVEYEEAGPAADDLEVLAPPAGSSVYKLESLPGATAVVLLDFDGQLVTGTRWKGGGTIRASASSFTESQVTSIWRLVSEDFRPFNINITTDSAKFFAAPANRRMRCIFTPTDEAAPGSGGVAYVNSFSNGSDNDTPCWVFNSGTRSAGEAASHEIGHTLGLRHDGRTSPAAEYFSGHGNWGPIMGASYSRTIVQWSKGEYTSANNTEDDLAIIVKTSNGITYRTDEAGSTSATSKALVVNSNGSVTAANNTGIIAQNTDIDVYSFEISAGNVNLTVNPSANYPNLDIFLELKNAAGTVLATASPTNSLAGTISTNLPAGTYYLFIDGTGNGSPSSSGYSDYGSIGEYSISGTIPAAPPVNQPPSVAISSPQNNQNFQTGSDLQITAIAMDADGTIAKVEFFINGVKVSEDATSPYNYTLPAVTPGTYSITVTAIDNNGALTTSQAVTFTVTSPQAPLVSITQPMDKATVYFPASLTISASATDTDGSIVKVGFYNDTNLLSEDLTAPYTYEWSNIPVGTYTLIATATDNTGLSASDTITFQVVLPPDCNGDNGGLALLDNCGRCTGGNTGKQACALVVQSEDACSYDGTPDTRNSGYLGTSYVNTNNNTGAFIKWEVESKEDQSVTLLFRYSNGSISNRAASLSINGIVKETLNFPGTGSFSAWNYEEAVIQLKQGINFIELVALTRNGLANSDLIGIEGSDISLAQCDGRVTSMAAKGNSETPYCYPNPFTSTFAVSGSEPISYVIYDLSGNEIERGSGKDGMGKNLLPGLYTVKLTTNSKSIIYKVIKQ